MTEILILLDKMFDLSIKIDKYKENESETVGFLAHVNLQIVELQKKGSDKLLGEYIATRRSIVSLRNNISNEYNLMMNEYQVNYNDVISNITKLNDDELLALKSYLDNELFTLNEYIDIITNSSENLALQCYLSFYGSSKNMLSRGEEFKDELIRNINYRINVFSNLSKYIEGINIARGNNKEMIL